MRKIIYFLILILLSINSYALYVQDRIYEGQTKLYSNNKGFYIVKLLAVSDVENTARFVVNDELSNALDKDNNYNYIFKDKSEIVIDDIIISEVGEPNPDLVEFYFYGSMNNPYLIEDLSKYIKENVTEKIIEKENKTEETKNITIIKYNKEEDVKKKEILQIIIDFFKKLFDIK